MNRDDKKQEYEKPAIKHELELEIRAGSPPIKNPLEDIFLQGVDDGR